LSAHVAPVNPGRHVQVKTPGALSEQVPPLRQGSEVHKRMGASHTVPVNKEAQVQLNTPVATSLQVPPFWHGPDEQAGATEDSHWKPVNPCAQVHA
jgi:hypothetical protein